MSELGVTELTEEIHEKYPKVWEKLKEKYHDNRNIFKNNSFCLNMSSYQKRIMLFHHRADTMTATEMPFSMLYGLLDAFFKENGIIVIPDYSVEDNEYFYSIYKNQYCVASTFEPGFMFKTFLEAKQQAILKACEVLGEKLK